MNTALLYKALYKIGPMVLILACVCACGQSETSSVDDLTTPTDITRFSPADGASTADTKSPNSDSIASGKSLQSIAIEVDQQSLSPLSRAKIAIRRTYSDGSSDLWAGDKSVVWTVDSVVQATAAPDTSGAKAPVALVWQLKEYSDVIAVHDGSAQIVAKMGELVSAPLTLKVKAADGEGARAMTTDAEGACSLTRSADPLGAIQFNGAKNGAGGLTMKMRFAEDAESTTPVAIKLATNLPSVDIAFADLGATQFKLAQGSIWFESDDPLKWMGTIVGRTTSLRPIVIRFELDRKGLFGIDLLEPAKVLKQSDALTPSTGVHYSRVSISKGDLSGGSLGSVATIFARRITNGLQAALIAWEIEGATGNVKTGPVTVHEANAYEGKPDTPAAAFGTLRRAFHQGLTCEIWEGRATKGADKPHRLWVMLRNSQGAPITAPASVDDGVCDGQCTPQVVALSSTRFAVLWSRSGQGVSIRRLRGQPKAGKVDWQDAEPKLISNAKDGVMANHGDNLVIGWYDPDKGPGWRKIKDSPSGKLQFVNAFQSYGASSTQTPRQGLVALEVPVDPPNLLFIASWLDFKPEGVMYARKITLDGAALAQVTDLGANPGQQLWSQAGKPGQVLNITTGKDGAIRAQTLRYQNYGSVAQQLGSDALLRAPSATTASPVMVYLPIADMWIVAWAGQDKSDGVWMRRFR